jgi:hypothetical protein
MSRSAITSYLGDLFASSPEAEAALEKLRKDIRDAGNSIRVDTLDASGMRNLIKSLLARDLLSAEKAATLKSFLDSDIIIEEVTSVLNMQMARLDDWEWPAEGVKVDMRRHLSGKYRYVNQHVHLGRSSMMLMTCPSQGVHGHDDNRGASVPTYRHGMEHQLQIGI